jgi:predicted RNase H-like HicB family nuclease/uncharacterized damage-inducible protein DinB
VRQALGPGITAAVPYSVTLEHGSDGSYLAWVEELPGCFVRSTSREEAIAKVPEAITDFHDWLRRHGETVDEAETTAVVVAEVDSAVETDEDTEVLLDADRRPLTTHDWERVARWLSYSRRDVLEALVRLADDELEWQPVDRSRTLREEFIHIAFVELMYAAWTFDLRTRDGLADFLAWTRDVAEERMRALADERAASLTSAEWAGAPRPEEWTARKAARRLIWHELLHLPDVRRRP